MSTLDEVHMLYAAYFSRGYSAEDRHIAQKESQMRNVTLNAAIATVLSTKFGGVAAEVIEREPIGYPSDSLSFNPKTSISHRHSDPAEKKKKLTRKRNKAASASRKRNRK